jgi:hypothetical protein
VRTRLNQGDCLNDGYFACRQKAHPPQQLAVNVRVYGSVEALQGQAITEDDLAQLCPINRAVGRQDAVSESGNDVPPGGQLGLHKLVRHHIGVDHGSAVLGQAPRHAALATGDIAGEADHTPMALPTL